MTATPLTDIVRTGATGSVRWLSPRRGKAYLGRSFPLAGDRQVAMRGDALLRRQRTHRRARAGPGWVVAPFHRRARNRRPSLLPVRDQGWRKHLFPAGSNQSGSHDALPPYCLTRRPMPLCVVAPGRRLADPTFFRHADHYWIACTDLDIGTHDNLCLLHAREPSGPWLPHRCTPVKIDICGARPAGPLFRLGSELFRPGQDCARTYGAAVVIHRVDELSPEHYRETVVTRALPDPARAISSRAPHSRGRPGVGLARRQAFRVRLCRACAKDHAQGKTCGRSWQEHPGMNTLGRPQTMNVRRTWQ